MELESDNNQGFSTTTKAIAWALLSFFMIVQCFTLPVCAFSYEVAFGLLLVKFLVNILCDSDDPQKAKISTILSLLMILPQLYLIYAMSELLGSGCEISSFYIWAMITVYVVQLAFWACTFGFVCIIMKKKKERDEEKKLISV